MRVSWTWAAASMLSRAPADRCACAQIDGMRMDLVKPRYETYDELYEYCYKVAGTVGLMTTPVMGIDPTYKVRPKRAAHCKALAVSFF